MVIVFIDDHRARFGVAPICTVLSEHGAKIAPSTYRDLAGRLGPEDEGLPRLALTPERGRRPVVPAYVPRGPTIRQEVPVLEGWPSWSVLVVDNRRPGAARGIHAQSPSRPVVQSSVGGHNFSGRRRLVKTSLRSTSGPRWARIARSRATLEAI